MVEAKVVLDSLGRLLIVAGGMLLVAGVVILLAGRIPFLGRLPGDIVIQREGFSCLIPVATSIILSLLLTLILNVIVRLLSR